MTAWIKEKPCSTKLSEILMVCNSGSLKDSCVNADGRNAASEEAIVFGTLPTGTDS